MLALENVIDYTPDSFGKMNPHDTRYQIRDPTEPAFKYNTNFTLSDTHALNQLDSKAILHRDQYVNEEYPNQFLDITLRNEPMLVPNYPRDLLIDQTDHDVYGNTYNDPMLYKEYIDNQIDGSMDQKIYNEFLTYAEKNPDIRLSQSYTSEKFWLEDPMVLFRGDNYFVFLPKSSMSKIEMLNAMTKFFLYLMILLLLFSNNYDYVYVPIIGIIIVLVLYYVQKNDTADIRYENFCRDDKCDKIEMCQAPTQNNPFMNVTLADLMDDPERPGACNINNNEIKQEIDEKYNYDLFRDVDDVFVRGYSQRQFYTTPSTTTPNDQTTFAKWLYKLPETCKENQSNCLKYEDIRFNRFNPNIDRMERVQEDIIP
uniref:Minor capsid protein P9 transmembrane helices domain-containing protein n=1 Tax=viral metagenome TaxID=1070528 RepID=A0A6C0C886_9ZZZZ